MRTRRTLGLIGVILSLAVILPAGQIAPVQAGSRTIYGEPKNLGDGVVRSLVVLNEQGDPVSIGIALRRDVFSGLPGGPGPSEVMLGMPDGVSVPPFDHFTVDWNPRGHEPHGIYDVPHFDFHFYLIAPSERLKISAEDGERFAKAPGKEYMPADYQATPGGVPGMGAHWVDVTSPEFHGKPFTTTFIYGTYDGKVIFYEPMMSSAFLEGVKEFSSEIKQPARFAREGYHPVTYRVMYREKEGEYWILLDGMTLN